LTKKRLKLLIVDDHPMIIEGYKNALQDMSSDDYELIIESAQDCDEGMEKIQNSTTGTPYDIIFLDIQLPPSKDGRILSGEDLGLRANRLSPSSKLVFLTMFNDNYRIHSILKNVNPDGFLVKSDVNSSELVKAFDTINNDPPYYSKSVKQFIRNDMTNRNVIDELDRKILFHLSKGVQTKDLPEYVSLSINAIEKRKKSLRKLFDISTRNDVSLIQKAKEQGFL
jgi:two-component system response regulator NreC|tara:strand:+ start:512 stop:1186 length:675 start_codon:yes stop_codon:yes gene_type:complete